MHSQPVLFAARRRAVLGAALAALTAPAWAARKKAAPAKPPRPLRAGQAFWLPDLSPTGPVVAAVNLHTQHVQLYRNGVAIGFSSISSGRPGYGTPVGLFNVLEKRRHHRSSKYDDAPMPWMVRLTWDGVAFHGGALPGYPASHGCIRLPMHFAPKLFGAIRYKDNVLVVRQDISEGQQPLTSLAPIDPEGKPLVHGDMLQDTPWWAPEPEPEAPEEAPEVALAASAAMPAAEPASAPASEASAPEPPQPPPKPVEPPQPLALLASTSQQRLFVLQDGRLLATAPLPVTAFDAVQDELGGRRLLRWDEGRWATLDGAMSDANVFDADVWRETLPTGEFAERLRTLLAPGSTLLLSDMPAVGDIHAAAWESRDRRIL